MKKYNIITIFVLLFTLNLHAVDRLTIANTTQYSLVLERIVIHDYWNFNGSTSGVPGPAEYGYDIGDSATTYVLDSTQYIIVPPYSSITLPEDPFASPSGDFPFGFNNPTNPFNNKVYEYATIGGNDIPNSTTPITLPIPYVHKEYCVKISE